jgi:hypothetical protein
LNFSSYAEFKVRQQVRARDVRDKFNTKNFRAEVNARGQTLEGF